MILHGLRRALIEGAPVELEEIFAGIEARHRRRRRARRRRPDPPRQRGARRDRPVRRGRGPARGDRRGLRVPLAVTPPVWLATGVELRVPITATAAGGADLVRVSPGPETVVAHADLAAGAAATLATVPPADGSYRYRLVLPGEAPRTLPLRVRPVRLAAIGDVAPGSALGQVRTHGPAWHWSNVGAWLRGRDVVIANLETAVGTGGRPLAGQELPLPLVARDHPRDGQVGWRRRRIGREQPRHRLRPRDVRERPAHHPQDRHADRGRRLDPGGRAEARHHRARRPQDRRARLRRLPAVRVLGDGEAPGLAPATHGLDHARRQGRARRRPMSSSSTCTGAPSCARGRERSRRRSRGRRWPPAPTSCWAPTRTCCSRS